MRDWVRKITYYIQLERIQYTIKGSTQKFSVAWRPFLNYLENVDADDIEL